MQQIGRNLTLEYPKYSKEADDSQFINEKAERFYDIIKAWLVDSERSADSVAPMTTVEATDADVTSEVAQASTSEDQDLTNVPGDTHLNRD